MKSSLYLCLSVLIIQTDVFGLNCLEKVISPEDNEGWITSPGYPLPYPSNICIMWYRVVSKNTMVTVTFDDLDIVSRDNCQSNASNRLDIGPHNEQSYCGFGTQVPKYQAVVGDFFYILFVIREYSMRKGRGFRLHFRLEETLTTTTTQKTTAASWNPWYDCGTTLTQASGIITISPNTFPCVQSKKRRFWWRLQTPDGSGSVKYRLNFEYFYRCTIDIYQGSDEDGSLVAHYDGISHPHHVIVNGPAVLVNLHLDGNLYASNVTIRFQREQMCPDGYRPCQHNESGCYPAGKRCDAVWDCPLHGGDERGCNSPCRNDGFPCGTMSNYCFPYEERCNGRGACANYRDEHNCTLDQCSPSKGLFLCKNKRCIYEKWTCDHTNDCEDGSDEDDCDKLVSPRLIMFCVVGTLVSSLLLVVALSFAMRVFAIRNRQRRGPPPTTRHDSPLTRIEQDLLRRRAPPPQYNEAMLTSRSYDEAYLELLSQGETDSPTDASSMPQEGGSTTSNALPPSTGSSGRGRSRRVNSRQRRRHHRNLRLQQMQQLPNPHLPSPPLYFAEQPPLYSAEMPPENHSNNLVELLGTNESGAELQTLPTGSQYPEPLIPPPYSLHNDMGSTSESDEDDEDDDDEMEGDYIENFPSRAGEDCELLGGSDDDEEEEDDTSFSIGLPSEPQSFPAPTTALTSVTSDNLGRVSDVLSKDDDGDDEEIAVKKEEDDNKECMPSSSSSVRQGDNSQDAGGFAHGSGTEGSLCTAPAPSRGSNVAKELKGDDDDDDECILSGDPGTEVMGDDEDDTSSDTACLLAQ